MYFRHLKALYLKPALGGGVADATEQMTLLLYEQLLKSSLRFSFLYIFLVFLRNIKIFLFNFIASGPEFHVATVLYQNGDYICIFYRITEPVL